MSEHGRRAWVLGQGQAATGTDARSTSCGRQRASQSQPARPHGRRRAPGPALPSRPKNTHLSEAPRGGGLPSMLRAPLLQARRAEGLPAGVGVPRPAAGLLGGSAGPRVLPTAPGRGFLGIWDPGGGQLAGPGRGRSPDRHQASPRRGSGLDPGVAIQPSTSWSAQVTQIQRSGVHREVLREANGPSP